MPTSVLSRFVHRVAAASVPDAALVRQFVDSRSDGAFAELVRRYGSMVFGVCRRIIGDHHLAEDAFQAVFVVLARRANTIRPPEAVGGWLFGVARKIAADAVRRPRREVLFGVLPERPSYDPEPADDDGDVDTSEDSDVDALDDERRPRRESRR